MQEGLYVLDATYPDTSTVVDTLSGILNAMDDPRIRIFPNPAQEFINIEFAQGSAPENFRLLDVAGREVVRWDNNLIADQQLMVPQSVTKGIYFLLFDQDGIKKNIKLVLD